MRLHLASSTLVALALVTPAALAGPGDRSDPKFAARALAEHGFALYEAGKYPEAIEALQQAERLFHAPTLVLALAKAHAAAGKLVEARQHLQRVVDERLSASAPPAFRDAQRTAQSELTALSLRIPTLQISVRGGGGRGLRVSVDEADVPGWSPDRPLPVNPGAHRITVVPLGGVGVSRSLNLKEGERGRVEIELPGAGPAVVGSGAPAGGDAASAPSRGWLAPSLASFGVGAVGLGVGIGAGVSAANSAAAIRKRCGGDVCPPAEQDNLSSAKGVAVASTVGFVLAGVGVATGVVLLIVRPGAKAPAQAALVVGPGSIGVTGVFR